MLPSAAHSWHCSTRTVLPFWTLWDFLSSCLTSWLVLCHDFFIQPVSEGIQTWCGAQPFSDLEEFGDELKNVCLKLEGLNHANIDRSTIDRYRFL
jgi:hypothetical protein